MIKNLFALSICLCTAIPGFSQTFTRADSLRGSLRPERTCFDVTYYDLQLTVQPVSKTIAGSNGIHFTVTEPTSLIQLDLFKNMTIDSIVHRGKSLSYKREFNAVFVTFAEQLPKGNRENITVYYQGKPTIAYNPPWDGGFTWTSDAQGKTWIGVSCEGIGASLWWPNKDHLSDEPDSMLITCTVPEPLVCISNGNLVNETHADSLGTFTWKVTYPINNYNVSLNIGDYVNIRDSYQGTEGNYDLDYYVLSYHEEIARSHFKQVKPMLDCYESFLGPYPFPRDGFALIETPYLGMEHQSGIAYGNDYKMGYRGFDLTGSGLGMLFDYIIIHETGHEYWGNSISMQDAADMWIHEGFCTYSEALYIECLYGKEKAEQYATAWANNIANDEPVIGHYGVNKEGSGDMYYKGAYMLHTLRTLVDNDTLWLSTIKSLVKDFRLAETNTQEIMDYLNRKLGKDYSAIMHQYLFTKEIPILEYRSLESGGMQKIMIKWTGVEPGFSMPVLYRIGKKKYWLQADAENWTEIEMKTKDFKKFALDNKNLYYTLKE